MDGLNAPRKKEAKKVIKKVNKTTKIKKENMAKENNKSSVLISIIVTALIVGGAIYAWQDRVSDSNLTEIKTKAKSTREGFERSLKNLENEVRKAEEEKKELLAKNNELKDKAELVEGALKEYKNDELSLRFTYPALFGDVDFKKITGSVGEKFVISFSRNPSFHMAGVSDSYKEANSGTSTEVSFDNFFQLEKKKDDYKASFFFNGEKEEYDLEPIESVPFSDGEALLVDLKSFSVKNGQASLDMGQNLGAVLSLDSEKFSGLAMLDSDFGQLSPDDFREILKSIKIK